MILAAECPAIPSSAVKIASERRCAILVHSDWPAAMYEVEVYKRKLDKMSGLLCEVLPDNFCERTFEVRPLGDKW